MKRNSFILLNLFCALLFLTYVTGVEAFQVTVSPQKIYQGDAFVVRITALKSPQAPSAVFNEKQIGFWNGGTAAVEIAFQDKYPGIIGTNNIHI